MLTIFGKRQIRMCSQNLLHVMGYICKHFLEITTLVALVSMNGQYKQLGLKNYFTTTAAHFEYNIFSQNVKGTEMSVSSTVFFTLLVTVISNCSASKTNKLVSVLRMDADGEKLIQMGTSFNNSMLKLIVHSFVNLK